MTLFSSFGKQKPKTPQELVNKTASALQHLNSAIRDKELEKASEEATKYISALKHSLQGSDDEHPDKAVVNATVEAMVTCDVLFLMVERLLKLDFETRKDVASIYSFVCKHKSENEVILGLEYLRTHHIIIELLFRGYDEPIIALNCGSMLRDCFRDELIAKRVLESSILQSFFDKVQVSSFELASDAFMSFKFLLTRHPEAVAEFLLIPQNYEMFFGHYTALLKSENYMTRRQSLKLLGELLMGRNNVRIMVQYVGNVANLMLVMNLLKDPSRTIQFEAFHVFKVFVANPRKPKKVVEILVSNKDKLLRYLSQFLEEKEIEDEDFKNEKADIMREIEELEREEGTQGISPSPSRPLDHFSAYGVSRPLEGASTGLDGFSRPLEGVSRPFEGVSRPLESISLSRPLEGVSRPLEGSSRGLDEFPHHMHGAVSSRGQADV